MEQLVSDDDYTDLPEDDDQCFAAFEGKIRASMTEKLDDDRRSGEYFQSIKSQYMAAVYSVALECGITVLPSPQFDSMNNFYEVFNLFELAVQGEVARIRIRGRRTVGATSVQLVDNTKTIIHHHVSQLRDAITAVDLPPDRKKVLNKKLDDLVEELEKRRLNLGKTMLTLGYVVAGLAGATTIAAEGPAAFINVQRAVTAIIKEVGVDKMSEDTAAQRLAPPHKALPAPPLPPAKAVAASAKGSSGYIPKGVDLDDEIPF